MITVTFKRVAAAFGEFSKVSDGSDDESSADLSDLVNSFLERETREQRDGNDNRDRDWNNSDDEDDDRDMESNSESRELLKKLFDGQNDVVRRKIRSEVEKACRDFNGRSPDFKRRLIARLRRRGFDAGLCKSKCEKNDRRPFGDYEYVEVNAAGERYIIEVYLAGEFTIARPTGGYAALLEEFPPIFVGKPDELREVVRLMCGAIRKSMKSVGITVPPWRRLGYMQSKWFGAYKRTTNETVSRKVAGGVEFVPLKGILFNCRDEFATAAGVRTGHLSAVLNQ